MDLLIPFSENESYIFAKEKSMFPEKQKAQKGSGYSDQKVSNSDLGHALAGNSAPASPGNPMTIIYANCTFGCHMKYRINAQLSHDEDQNYRAQ